MIHIIYTLRGEDDESIEKEVKKSPQVPRIGELICFDPLRSYQVIDVLWHLGGNDPYVTVTACELNWHKHIAQATADWEDTHHPDR